MGPTKPPRVDSALREIPAWLAGAVLLLAVLLAYANCYRGDFLFDGARYVRDNPRVQSVSVAAERLLRPRGLTYFSYSLNYAVSGWDPWSYHALNVALHAANALLLYALVRIAAARVGSMGLGPSNLAFSSALLWACHPLHTQAVTYIYQRSEVLASFFYLVSMASLAWAAASSRRAPLGLSVVASVVGLSAKIILATSPAAALVFDRVFLSPSWREVVRRRGLYHLAMALPIVAAASLLLLNARGIASSGIGSGAGVTPWEYAATQPAVLLYYLRVWLFPAGQYFVLAWPVAESIADAVPGILGLSAVLAGSLWLGWKSGPLGYCAFWFFLILAPTSSVVPIVDLAFENRPYLASAGLAVLSVAALKALLDRAVGAGRSLKPTVAAVAVWAILLGGATLARNAVYTNELTIWSDVLRKNPRSFDGYINLAKAFADQGDFENALKIAVRGAEVFPDSALAANQVGAALRGLGRPGEAREHFRRSVAIEPSALALRNWAIVVADDDPERAIELLTQALELRGPHGETHFLLGQLAHRYRRDPSTAAEHFSVAIELSPAMTPAYNALAVVLVELGRPEEARDTLNAAIRIDPSSEQARIHLKELD